MDEQGDNLSSKAVSGAETGRGSFTSNIINGGVSWAVVAAVGALALAGVLIVMVWKRNP